MSGFHPLPAFCAGPDPVVEAYKKDVDRTLIRENLKLTSEQRIQKMIAALRFHEEVRASKGKK